MQQQSHKDHIASLSPAMRSYLGHITADGSRYPADTEDDSDPVVRRVVRPEDPGMYGVQTWSAGPIYPAIIRVVETYDSYGRFMSRNPRSHIDFHGFYDLPLERRLLSRQYELTIPGWAPLQFDTRDEAEEFAISMQGKVPA